MSERARYLVVPSRLESGGSGPRDTAGDIYSSYSADTIMGSSKVRKPFAWHGRLWITVSLCSFEGSCTAEAYRLIPKSAFADLPTTYRRRTRTSEDATAARNDPMGFYHGMTVTRGRDSYVLTGPPASFRAASDADEISAAIAQEAITQLALL